MGTILASAIIASARVTLLDPSSVTWTDADLLRFINEGERFVCELRPELFTKRIAMTLAVGTVQSLPSDGTAFLSLEDNITSGRRCRLVEAALLDTVARFWPAATQETDVQEYAFDLRDRKRFIVLPPNNGSGSVRVLYGAVPPSLPTVGTAINLDDVYEGVLKQFLLSEAYSANTTRQDMAKWNAHRNAAKEMLGINAQSLAAALPKVT